MKWKTKNGEILDSTEMTIEHIENCIKYCKKWNKKGVPRCGGYDVEDMYYEEDHHFFDDEIEVFEKELQKRKGDL